MAEKNLERSFTVSLRRVFDKPRTRRAEKAVRFLKRFLRKNFRVAEKQIKISEKINGFFWQNGIEHIPRRIEIKAVLEDGIVRAFLSGEKIGKKEEKKEKKEEKKETPGEKEKEKEIEEKKKEKKAKEKATEKAAIKRHTM